VIPNTQVLPQVSPWEECCWCTGHDAALPLVVSPLPWQEGEGRDGAESQPCPGWEGGMVVTGWLPRTLMAAEPAIRSHRAQFQLLTALSFLLVTNH
jgi:hypothetical protein